jgi:hypothetical protein
MPKPSGVFTVLVSHVPFLVSRMCLEKQSGLGRIGISSQTHPFSHRNEAERGC